MGGPDGRFYVVSGRGGTYGRGRTRRPPMGRFGRIQRNPPPQDHPDVPLQAGQIVGSNLYSAAGMASEDSVGRELTTGVANKSLREMGHRLTREQATAAVSVATGEARLEATIQQIEAGIESLVGQGGSFSRYRVASTGDAQNQLWVAVDSQGGTPSKPMVKELKQEAQRGAKVWQDSRRRVRMDVEPAVKAQT